MLIRDIGTICLGHESMQLKEFPLRSFFYSRDGIAFAQKRIRRSVLRR